MQTYQVAIEITRGRTRRRLRQVDTATFLIGSAEDCDLVLAAPGFPEVHAYLMRHTDGVLLRYLGAKPALTVNGKLVRSERLADGDRIVTGPYEFAIHIETQPLRSRPLRPYYQRLNCDLSEPVVGSIVGLDQALQWRADVKAALISQTVATVRSQSLAI